MSANSPSTLSEYADPNTASDRAVELARPRMVIETLYGHGPQVLEVDGPDRSDDLMVRFLHAPGVGTFHWTTTRLRHPDVIAHLGLLDKPEQRWVCGDWDPELSEISYSYDPADTDNPVYYDPERPTETKTPWLDDEALIRALRRSYLKQLRDEARPAA